MRPIRIQRKRVKGWNMPENTVSVTRPGDWGNPFKIGEYFKMGKGGMGFCWITCYNHEIAKTTGYTKIENAQMAVDWFREYRRLYPIGEKMLAALRGKNLACFCPLDQPCHADVLLEIASIPITSEE